MQKYKCAACGEEVGSFNWKRFKITGNELEFVAGSSVLKEKPLSSIILYVCPNCDAVFSEDQ